jgi:hypothetical protein
MRINNDGIEKHPTKAEFWVQDSAIPFALLKLEAWGTMVMSIILSATEINYFVVFHPKVPPFHVHQ